MTTILTFALKRAIIARLTQINDGTIPAPAGTEALLAANGVQVAPMLPPDPDRIVVYGAPVRSTRESTTEEQVTSKESITCEIRIRVYQPGQDDADADTVDALLSQVANAVAVAVVDSLPLIVARDKGDLSLTDVQQWPSVVSGNPEPAITGLASLIFSGELVTT